MTISPVAAAHLYSVAKPATQPDQEQSGTAKAFAQVAADFTQTLQAGEDTARAAMTGNADLPSLVEALAKSELAVEAAVTIRNKVVEAYQEILRMPV